MSASSKFRPGSVFGILLMFGSRVFALSSGSLKPAGSLTAFFSGKSATRIAGVDARMGSCCVVSCCNSGCGSILGSFVAKFMSIYKGFLIATFG
ncbi:hypothetical protein LXL04_020259 [Taraxacum kok-saghyz]